MGGETINDEEPFGRLCGTVAAASGGGAVNAGCVVAAPARSSTLAMLPMAVVTCGAFG